MLSPRGNVIRLLRHAVRVRYGSFSTGTRPAAGPAVSAVAPKAEGWFTEGFDTLDLKEAKALLGELVS